MYVYIHYTYEPVLNLHSDVAVIGFEKTSYEFQRSEGVVHVCAVVFTPEDVSCPIEFDFSLLITINEGGKEYGSTLTMYIF